MKKTLLTIVSTMLLSTAAMAQGTITLTTTAEPGTQIEILPNALSATSPVSIDFGDGQPVNYTVDPNQWAYNRWIRAEIKGSTIVVKGNLTEFQLRNAQLTSATVENMSALKNLDLAENELTEFELKTITPLERLSLNNNKLYNSAVYNATLSLEYAGETLKTLAIYKNEGLQCLDLRYMNVLEDLQASDCPDLASVFICLPEESREALKYINLNNCTISHFYPVNLPNLYSLHLANNILMTEYDDDPFSLGSYPNLRNLTLTGNKGVKTLDVTKCPLLEQLYIDDCNFSSIDVAANPELTTLNIAGNSIKSLDLGNNKLLNTLLVQGNPISELSLPLGGQLYPATAINTLDISDTQISRIDLMRAPYLHTFHASNTKLEFVDFNGQQADRMRVIDLRNNPNFTYESMAYTVATLPVARQAWSTNLWLEGSNAEKSNLDYATSSDMQWICDVTGDGSAEFSPLNVTFDGAEATGEVKKGELERLYPMFGLGLSYDLKVMSTTGGKFVVAQWKAPWFQSIMDVATEGYALKGVPMYVYCYPDEGKTFRSVTVNGKEIKSPWFIISEDANVKVNFTNELPSITLTVPADKEMSFLLNTDTTGESVWIDWGTGQRTEYPNQNGYTTGYLELKGTRIDGHASGTQVTLYGNIAGLNLDGFGEVAEWFGLWDNHVTGIDLSNAPGLKFLSAYWNPIESIDLSGCPAMEVLDLSYTALKDLDVTCLPGLLSLEAYAAGEDEDGINNLNSIDLTKNPLLQNLNIKNNRLTAIDLTKNPHLVWVNICGNPVGTVDLAQNPYIEELDAMNCALTSLDLTAQTQLVDLSVDNNELTSLDLSKNTKLETLMISNNPLHSIDLSGLKELQKLYLNGNGLSAEELNDICYTLPKRVEKNPDAQGGMTPSWNLCIYQGTDKEENDYTGYDSSIALDRSWTPSHSASNGGCDVAYLDLLSALHGSYTVTDAAGKEYFNGSKVAKWLPLTIHPEAENGYKFYSFQLNDDAPIMDNDQFLMPGIYTKLRVTFAKSSGIEEAEAAEFGVRPVAGGVEITTAAATPVAIYNTAGALIASMQVAGTQQVALTPGFYIVRAGSAATSVAVK